MTSINTGVSDAITLLHGAYQAAGQFEALPASCAPQTVAEAYAIQDGLARKLWLDEGLRTSSWKVGAPRPGVTPYSAPIPPQRVHDSGARVDTDTFHMIGIEGELAFRLGRSLAPRAELYSQAEVKAAIGELCVTIELVDTRLQDWQQAGELWRLADNQINGALVVGNGVTDWQNIELGRQPVILRFNGEEQANKVGGHPLGDPTLILTEAVNHLVARNGGLQAGDLITSGTWTGMIFVEPGTEVEVVFPGIGEARVSLGE
ncbi:fumarylacetoacetate hydrolase family protein [uncultured Oceanisphaera sp.]|uniref:2-keto-4-pentenoate hydratase n=1 Tax=uncultured Oceanisphaera sp. TaxID=353858 RepID=UPI00262D5E4D|nr:fumarylacetoacetate hydrolase family protein [uncultured Oceanisphaera sp.]